MRSQKRRINKRIKNSSKPIVKKSDREKLRKDRLKMCPSGKAPFRRSIDAKLFIATKVETPMRVYYCRYPSCKKWHITSRATFENADNYTKARKAGEVFSHADVSTSALSEHLRKQRVLKTH